MLLPPTQKENTDMGEGPALSFLGGRLTQRTEVRNKVNPAPYPHVLHVGCSFREARRNSLWYAISSPVEFWDVLLPFCLHSSQPLLTS